MSSFSTCATKNTIKWCMLTQIWSATDIIFCHFRPFFALLPHYWPRKSKFGKYVKNTWRYFPFTHVHHKSRSYDVWFLRYKVQRTKSFVILGHFFPFDPPNNPKNQNFEKTKKSWRYCHFTLVYHKWRSYDVWFLRYQAQQQSEFVVILGYFCLFTPLIIQKIKILKKWKNLLEISSFYTWVS